MRDVVLIAIVFILTNIMSVGALMLANILPQKVVIVADAFLNLSTLFLIYDGIKDGNDFEALTGFVLMGVCAVLNSYFLLSLLGI